MADEKNQSGTYGQDSYGQEGASIPPAPEFTPAQPSPAPASSGADDPHAGTPASSPARPFPAAPSYDSPVANRPSAADPTAPAAPTDPTLPESSPFQPQNTTPMGAPAYGPQPTTPLPDWQQPAGYQGTPPIASPVATPADPYQAAHAAAQPQYAAPIMAKPPYGESVAELSELTGGMKFGWLCVGLFMSIVGMLIAWLVNVDKHPQVKKDAILWSVIGFAIRFVFVIIASVAFTGMLMAAISSSGYYGGGYYF